MENAVKKSAIRFIASSDNYKKIPGMPIAYWVSNLFASKFVGEKIEDYYYPKFGVSTGDGDRFIRSWFEVETSNIMFDCEHADNYLIENKTWNVADKGGGFRRWYGNKQYVIRWKNNGQEIKAHPKAAVRNSHFFFLPHISWTLISSNTFSARIFGNGYLVDTASNCIYYTNRSDEKYVLALLNSKVCDVIFQLLNPTINMSCGVVAKVPYIIPFDSKEIDLLSSENIQVSKDDWDSFETSWEFKKHPLI